MENEFFEFPHLRVSGLLSLSTCGIQRNHYLTKKPHLRRQHVSVGKGKNIGWPIVTKKAAIEIANSLVTGQKDVDLRGLIAGALEAGSDQVPQCVSCGTGRPPLPVKLNSIHSVPSSG